MKPAPNAIGPRVPLWAQLFVPAAALVLAAIVATAGASAWLVAESGRRETERRLDQLAETLASSSFPRTREALEQLGRITGDQWALWDFRRHLALATSVPLPADWLRRVGEAARAWRADPGRGRVAAPEFGLASARVIPLRDDPGVALLALTPAAEQPVRAAALRTAAAVAGLSLLALAPGAWWLAGRLRRRLARVGHDVAAWAEGREPAPPRNGEWRDELSDLRDTVRSLAQRLQEAEARRRHAERTEAAARWSAGVAHQFRNGLAGVRLAIQLHERRCAAAAGDASLRTAVGQLRLVEEEIHGLLALGRREPPAAERFDLAAAVRAAFELTAPRAQHLGIAWTLTDGPPLFVRGQPVGVRSATINLAMNALEAAGEGGHATLRAERRGAGAAIVVEDDGPGPPPELAARLAEPYVSSKPEGLGVGLAVAAAVAAAHGGALAWRRDAGRTVFEITFPGLAEPA